MENTGRAIDAIGVAVIVLGAALACAIFLKRQLPQAPAVDSYRELRQTLGRSLLLGLEFLVAGDIIRTVAATPTFTSVGVLAIIVFIRTFLSFSVQLEVTGRWPWERKEGRSAEAPEASLALKADGKR